MRSFELVPTGTQAVGVMEAIPAPAVSQSARDLLDAFLSAKSPNTLEAYRTDLEVFRGFVGAPDLGAAVTFLLKRSAGEANHLALTYRNRLAESGLQPATINRRLASLRSLTKLARTLGFISWEIEIANVKSRPYRDTRGPGRQSVENALDLLETQNTPKAVRDRAIIHLFFTLALRISEVIALDHEDVDFAGKRISILGKGRTEKEFLSVPEACLKALSDWLQVRGSSPGPLFCNFDRARKGTDRVTRSGLYKTIRALGDRLGIRIRPHGFRHSSVTEAIKAAQAHSIPLTEVRQFSRHASLATLQRYWDAERDAQGQLAQLVSDRLRSRGAK